MTNEGEGSELAGPSPSGARVAGDDLQHLIAWYWCLKASRPGSDIHSVAVEADHVGNLDDVNVIFNDGRRRYVQVKAGVDATGLVNVEWLKSPTSGPLLKRMFEAWQRLPDAAEVALITSRPLDPGDPLIGHRDRRNHLGPRIRRQKTQAVTAALQDLATDVGCSVGDLLDFFDVLEIQLGQTEADWREKVNEAAIGAGVRTDDATRALGLMQMREWVKTSRSPKPADELRELIDSLGIREGVPRRMVVVQTLDRIVTQSDDLVVDWVDRFRGDSPTTRRGVLDLGDWVDAFPRELAELRDTLRANQITNVAVRGAMRLPVWFAVGAHLLDVQGFDVAAFDRGRLWAAASKPGISRGVEVVLDQPTDSPGNDVALVVEVSAAAHDDAIDYFSGSRQVGRIIVITLAGGPNRALLPDGPGALAAAVEVRDWVRSHLRGTQLHMVLIASGPFALFLGHLWDRVPTTTIYEDLLTAYEPAFRFGTERPTQALLNR